MSCGKIHKTAAKCGGEDLKFRDLGEWSSRDFRKNPSFRNSVASGRGRMDDLVQRGGLSYEKFTNNPFTGEVAGETGI
jgi:hypothetical protein